ncbi:MAG: hypothetical protein JXA57_16830 [Armatimonadetes bacterium]|nr:hypothetical protein [Armatimonadota bacterium]
MDDRDTLTWEYDVPLVNDLYLLKDLAMVIVLSLVGMQVCVLIVGFFAGEGAVILPWIAYAVAGGALVVLFFIAAVVLLRNRFRTHFTVSPEGVAYESGRRERRINRIGLAVTTLAGRPGPSALATARESGGFPWEDVHKVTVHDRRRVITLSDSWHPILRLYCPPETFGATVSLVQRYATQAASERAGQPQTTIRRQWWFYVVWTVGVVVATLLGLFYYDLDLDDTWRWVILSGVLVLVAGLAEAWLIRRLFALAGVGLGIYVLVVLLIDASQPIVGPSGAVYGRSYQVDTWALVVSIIGLLVLIGMGAWRLFGRLREPVLVVSR